MDKPLVSIIVPIYNTELYLRECLDSIVLQTYSNLEVILVDDGSTDSSWKICCEYLKKDNRIKIFHQNNSGQASARNYAAKQAKGEYILYVDSDDYLNSICIERMVDVSIQFGADMVQCCEVQFKDKSRKKKHGFQIRTIKEYNNSRALREFCYQRIFNPAPWGKLIYKKIMEGMYFPEDIGYEDYAVVYKILGKAKKIVVIPDVLYFYRVRKGSTMRSTFSKKKLDRIIIAKEFREYIYRFFPENNIAVQNRFLLANFQLLMDLPFDCRYKEIRREVKRNIIDCRMDVLNDKNSKKSIRCMAAISYLGIPVLMILGRLYKRMV